MFIICGEALIDLFIENNRQSSLRQFPVQAMAGGSPFNVAIGLARLGQAVSLLTGLSHDMFGKRLSSVLKDEGVSQQLIVKKQLPTTVAFIENDENGIPNYSFWGEGAADRSLLPKDIDLNIDAPLGIHLGSYTIVTQPTADSLLSFVKEYAGKCLISLDPNVRAMVEPNMALWRNRVDELIQLADIVKVSDEDLELMYPNTQAEKIIEKWLVSGLKMAVLTRGVRGSTLWSAQGKVEIKVPRGEVVDTVGAGDSYQAALLDYTGNLVKQFGQDWVSKLSVERLEDLGTYATAAAAITCSRQGADLPTKPEIVQTLKVPH